MSQQKLKVFVYYFVQNDAFDGLTEPNIYAVPQSYTNVNQVLASHIYDSFPLKFENFYLRFFLEDKTENMKLWMDYPPDARIPIYGDKTYVKVLRLPKIVKLSFKNNEMFEKTTQSSKKNKEKLIEFNSAKIKDVDNSSKSDYNSVSMNKESTNSKVVQPNVQKNSTSNSVKDPTNSKESSNGNAFNLDNLDVSKIGSTLHESPDFEFVSNEIPINNESNLNVNKEKPSISNNAPLFDIFSPTVNNNLVENDTTEKNKVISNTLFGLSDLNWDTTGTPQQGQPQQSSPVIILPSTSNYPIDNIPSHLDEDSIIEKVNDIVKKWSFGVNERKNLRFILGTFYEVWTAEPMWKEISMETLIHDQSCVKTYYKKALGQTHPDKNAYKDFKTKYTADVLYNILTQAKSELPK